MSLTKLFNSSLIIVSGKGGVGKTTVSLALGFLASSLGKKTLLCEVNSAERIAPLFQLKQIAYHEKPLDKNLHAINIDPHHAFEEYLLEQIGSEKLYRLVFENRYVRNFLDATPGLSELLEIGKIWSLAAREKDPVTQQLKYDLVIVDAPATGHGLALMNVPAVVSNAIKIGPLKTQADRILEFLRNPQKTSLVLVSLAEEMPVSESLEMIEKSTQQTGVGVRAIFMNALMPKLLSQNTQTQLGKVSQKKNPNYLNLLESVQHYQRRYELEQYYLKQMKEKSNPLPVYELPYIFRQEFDLEAIKEIAGAIQRYVD